MIPARTTRTSPSTWATAVSKREGNTASGVPRMVSRGVRQMDGNRSPEYSKPVKGGGLAGRDPVPNRASDSGIEKAMQAQADQLHPRGK